MITSVRGFVSIGYFSAKDLHVRWSLDAEMHLALDPEHVNMNVIADDDAFSSLPC